MTRQRTLLVLDDDEAVCETVRFIAEDAGLEVRTTTSPVEFLDFYDASPPDLVVLDLIMPQMDGVEVMNYLARRRFRAGIIISSGVGGRVLDAARRTAREHGLVITGVLSKPFSPAALKNLLVHASPAETPAREGAAGAAEGPVEPVEITEKAIALGLSNREFRPVFQPIVISTTETLAGFEALARWYHPRGVIMPARFIPVAESLGLVEQISRRILEQSMRWIAQAYPDRKWALSANLSAASLISKRLANDLEAMCTTTGFDPTRLVLELTETAAMEDPAVALEILTRLRMKGFQLSIDDFGTGYSSLAQLARMPFSELKVDKSFTISAAESGEARTIIHSIVDLGHNLGLRVVAEGVEDEQTLNFLRHIGCDYAQGFHIGKPQPADEIEQWVRRNYAIASQRTRN